MLLIQLLSLTIFMRFLSTKKNYPQKHFFSSVVCCSMAVFASLYTVTDCWLFPIADNFRDFPCDGSFERNTAFSNLEIHMKISHLY